MPMRPRGKERSLPGQVTGREGAPTGVAEQLIATKLAPPSVRAGYVPRQRLIDALDAGSDLRLTLVDAPTGYGKTMLVAAWCAEVAAREESVISWLSLAATENDPALLTRYLIDALRRAGGAIGDGAEAMLRVPGASPTAWMRSLVNDLVAVQAQVTLVLDDYHSVTEPACHALVQFLLDHAPASLHLIVCTRADPPIGLGSLRALGQLAEVRTADLRFTDGEAAALLVETEGLNIDAQAVESLAARTEGWAAGLYLAALWLRGRGGPEADVERFAGDNRHVVEYLSEVVLDQLGPEVREFLLRTSVLDRLCSSLCEAITKMPAAGMLDEIERSNVFLVPLDDTRTWYRYHHLFADMLRSELARRHPDLVAVLHRRASAWYRGRGLVSDAIEQATSAGDYGDAAELISEYWLEIGRWGQEATLRTWLQAFEPDELQLHPELSVIGAFLTGVSGGSEIEFRRWLELAERGIARAEQNRTPVVDAAALRTRLQQVRSAFGYRNIRTATTTAARTARVESEGEGVLRVAVLANLAFLLYLSGDPATARHVLSEAIRDPLAQRRPYGFIIALTTSALIAFDEGDADNGQHAASRALEFAADAGLADNQISGLAHVALGRALTAAGRPDSARTEIEHGVRLLRGGVMPAQQIYALLWAAPAAQATGDLPSALRFTEEAAELHASFDDAGTLTTLLHDVQRRLSLARRRRHEPDSAALTEAEVAVLRALRSPKSQRAIAQELSISINTVKTHTSAIYRKLAVGSRDDAITRATELGLL
jgi:LuxR family transcriptional regulator, maltose regulon positive regulatory protein